MSIFATSRLQTLVRTGSENAAINVKEVELIRTSLRHRFDSTINAQSSYRYQQGRIAVVEFMIATKNKGNQSKTFDNI